MSAPTATLFRAARPAIFQHAATRAAFTGRAQGFRNFAQNTAGRRYQSTSAAGEAATQSWLTRMWNSPVGIKTVHFW